MYTDRTSSHPEHKLYRLKGITYVKDLKVRIEIEFWDISEAWALRRAKRTFGRYWVCIDIEEFKQYPIEDKSILRENIRKGEDTLNKDLKYIMIKKWLNGLE